MRAIEKKIINYLRDSAKCLNPLNQVYVFNPTAHNIFYNKELQPHFRRGHLFLLQFRVFLL